jgi:hypothetical protein
MIGKIIHYPMIHWRPRATPAYQPRSRPRAGQAGLLTGRNGLLLATPQLKKQKKVGRFFWKNLEAKPLNFEFA